MEKTITVHMEAPMTARMASQMAMCIAAIDARVLLRRGNMTVNAKSLMGLVSLSPQDGDEICIDAEGSQAEKAIEETARLLGA